MSFLPNWGLLTLLLVLSLNFLSASLPPKYDASVCPKNETEEEKKPVEPAKSGSFNLTTFLTKTLPSLISEKFLNYINTSMHSQSHHEEVSESEEEADDIPEGCKTIRTIKKSKGKFYQFYPLEEIATVNGDEMIFKFELKTRGSGGSILLSAEKVTSDLLQQGVKGWLFDINTGKKSFHSKIYSVQRAYPNHTVKKKQLKSLKIPTPLLDQKYAGFWIGVDQENEIVYGSKCSDKIVFSYNKNDSGRRLPLKYVSFTSKDSDVDWIFGCPNDISV